MSWKMGTRQRAEEISALAESGIDGNCRGNLYDILLPGGIDQFQGRTKIAGRFPTTQLQEKDMLMRTAAKVLVDTLVAHGIDRAFCVGESYLAVMDALHDDPVLDLVSCRHEGGAAWMALADAKLTGRAGSFLPAVDRGDERVNCRTFGGAGSFPLVMLMGQVVSKIGDSGN